MRFRQLLPLFGALFALYIIWGSTLRDPLIISPKRNHV